MIPVFSVVIQYFPSGKMPPFTTLQFYTGLCFLVRASNTTGSPWRASVISDHTEQAGILEGEDFFIFLEEIWLGSCCSVFCSLKFYWVYQVFKGDHHVYENNYIYNMYMNIYMAVCIMYLDSYTII